ncbi:hypothetical protein IC582_023304 [Cucumis melo]|nr:non-specific lipid transfer protein GPI-anchored 1 [Cucumis melo]
MKSGRKVMRSAGVVLAVVAVCLLGRVVPGRAEEENLKEECSNDFEKVVSCFAYATGKAAAPTEECCDSIEGIKESKPKCLCFFIQQTHNGNQQIKSLGIQEIKLLQLPSVCHLKNSSVSYCPKLLGLPANSPDAAIFSNLTSPATPASATTTRTSPDGNAGTKTVANSPVGLMAVAMVVVISFTVFLSPITYA